MHRTRSLVCLSLAITWTFACQRAELSAQPEATPVSTDPTSLTNRSDQPAEAMLATDAPGAARHMVVEPAPATAGSVGVEVIPQYEHVHADSRELNLLVRLRGIGEAPAARPPMDLAVVIDRSGSMRGDKIRDVKAAALELLDTLRPDDTVSLVSYSNDVQLHTVRLPVDEPGRTALRTALLGLHADGGTALGPGMMQALGVLESGQGDGARMAHVLLFSDGLANVGEQRPEVLGVRAAEAFSRGVSVSTLGVGLDYNEDLMTRLADQGGGRYHFIRDSEAIAGILDDEMKGMVATVARGLEMSLAPAGGVEVVNVFGYATSRDGAGAHARVGSLGAGQTREIVVRLRLPGTAPARLALGTLGLGFVDVSAGGAQRHIEVPLAVTVTDDVTVARASEHKDVTVRVAEVESAETMELAARAADRGDFAAASGSLDQAIVELEQQAAVMPSPKLQRQIVELRQAKTDMAEAQRSNEGRKAYTKKLKAQAYSSRKK